MVTGEESRLPKFAFDPRYRNFESAMQLAPTSRLTSTLRQLTDTRNTTFDLPGGVSIDGPVGNLLKKTANVGTGFRFTTVEPEQQRRVLLDKLRNPILCQGGREFTRPSPPKEAETEASRKLEAFVKERERELRN